MGTTNFWSKATSKRTKANRLKVLEPRVPRTSQKDATQQLAAPRLSGMREKAPLSHP